MVGTVDIDPSRHGHASFHSYLAEPHRGKGLGFRMYEAAISHTRNTLGILQVKGGQHTPDAHRIHDKLAEKYGLNYEGGARVGHTNINEREVGVYHRPYRFSIAKSEFSMPQTTYTTLQQLRNRIKYYSNPKAPHPHDNVMWIEDDFYPFEKGKKDALAMYKQDSPGKATSAEHVKWAYGLGNENWALWTVRHHRDNPQDFTPMIRRKIARYAKMAKDVPELKDFRFDKTHNLKQGLGFLKDAEDKYIERMKSQLHIANKPPSAKKILDFGDGTAWWDLGKESCSSEGNAMGHCGNQGGPKLGDSILSFRTEHKLGGRKYYEPNLTFIRNGNVLGEMKGRGNERPAPHYHEKIMALINQEGLFPAGGGYKPDNNFSLKHLTPEQLARVHPDITNALTSLDAAMKFKRHDGSRPHLEEMARTVTDPNTIDFLLKDALDSGNYDMAQTLAENPNITPQHQDALIGKAGLTSLLESEKLHPDLMLKYAKPEDLTDADTNQLYVPDVLNRLLNNPNLTMEATRRLMSSHHYRPDVHGEVLATKAKDPELQRQFLATNPLGLAENPNTVPEVQNAILDMATPNNPDSYHLLRSIAQNAHPATIDRLLGQIDQFSWQRYQSTVNDLVYNSRIAGASDAALRKLFTPPIDKIRAEYGDQEEHINYALRSFMRRTVGNLAYTLPHDQAFHARVKALLPPDQAQYYQQKLEEAGP